MICCSESCPRRLAPIQKYSDTKLSGLIQWYPDAGRPALFKSNRTKPTLSDPNGEW